MTRVLPHDTDAERAVLGSMLLSREVQQLAAGKLDSSDFFSPFNGSVFEKMKTLVEGGKPFDALALSSSLRKDGIGGDEVDTRIVEMGNFVSTASMWEQYADIVKRNAVYRRMIEASISNAALAYDAPDDIQDAVGQFERTIFSVTQQAVNEDFTPVGDSLSDAFEHLRRLYDHDGVMGVTTGFADFDHLTSGLKAGELVILAARPAMGKTALALNMAVEASKAGTPVAVFSLEMAQRDITQRLICAEAMVSLQDIKSKRITDEGWASIHQSMKRLSELDLVIDDSPSLNVTELRAKATRHFRNKQGGLIIVDYLQLMTPTKRKQENRQVEIAEISRGLKILAKDLGVPIIALSQLNRAVEARQSKKPVLSDLRESGAIEQDADMVAFIDRGGEGVEKGMAELIIAKHRNGPTGTVKLIFREMYTKFETPRRH